MISAAKVAPTADGGSVVVLLSSYVWDVFESRTGMTAVSNVMNGFLDIKVERCRRCGRNNLCFDGVREEANESWSTTENKIKEIISTKLNIQTDEFTIERAHRVGKQYTSDKPRPIVAKFNNYKVKESIMKNKKGLKGSNVYIREDFSQKVLARRKELLPKMYEERKNGNIAVLRYDRLVVYPGPPITTTR